MDRKRTGNSSLFRVHTDGSKVERVWMEGQKSYEVTTDPIITMVLTGSKVRRDDETSRLGRDYKVTKSKTHLSTKGIVPGVDPRRGPRGLVCLT